MNRRDSLSTILAGLLSLLGIRQLETTEPPSEEFYRSCKRYPDSEHSTSYYLGMGAEESYKTWNGETVKYYTCTEFGSGAYVEEYVKDLAYMLNKARAERLAHEST